MTRNPEVEKVLAPKAESTCLVCLVTALVTSKLAQNDGFPVYRDLSEPLR